MGRAVVWLDERFLDAQTLEMTPCGESMQLEEGRDQGSRSGAKNSLCVPPRSPTLRVSGCDLFPLVWILPRHFKF